MYSYAGFHCRPILQILCSAELVLHPRIRLGCAQQPAAGWRSTVRLAPAIFYSRTSTGCPCQTVLCPCRRCACVAGAHGLGFVPIDSLQGMAFDSASSTRRLSSSFSLSARPRVVLKKDKEEDHPCGLIHFCVAGNLCRRSSLLPSFSFRDASFLTSK